MSDRSRDVSRALTEVRTVLSRAETALAVLENERKRHGDVDYRFQRVEVDGARQGTWECVTYEADPDIDQMQTALGRVIYELGKWRKAGSTGSTRRRRWITGAS